MRCCCLFAWTVGAVCLQFAFAGADVPIPPKVDRKLELVPMRDGVRLRTTVFWIGELSGRRPCLVMRTPYNQQQYVAQAERVARNGYVAVLQDCRGRFGSEGAFVFYWGEGPDGFDTVAWIHNQPWSDGKVGMWGPSYMGSVQWLTAAEGTPLAALAPTAGASNFYYNLYVGGAYMLPMARAGFSMDLFGPSTTIGGSPKWSEWYQHLPLTDWGRHLGRRLPWQETMIEHYLPDGFWKRADASTEFERMSFPAQHIVGYFDFMCRDAVRTFQAMSERAATPAARSNQQLILGPWDHGTGGTKAGEVDFGPAAQLDVLRENLHWFDRFLKRSEIGRDVYPRVRYFSMNENRWYESSRWPPSEARTVTLYLDSDGHANSRRGDGRLSTREPNGAERDVFTSDPNDPVPAWPAKGRAFQEVWGPVDQQPIQDRPDVLVFASRPLTRPLRFAGPLSTDLWVSADTADADWIVKLIDVLPDGRAMSLATGVLRGSARESELRRSPLKTGERYWIAVDMGHAAAQIDAGHRLAVQIAGTNFPLFDRNLHTGEGPSGTRTVVSHETVWHTTRFVSRLCMPMVQFSEDAGL